MAQSFAKQFYNSKAWQDCREAYIISVNGLCERCLKHGNFTPGYIVHHKILLTAQNINDPNISLNHEHLEYQCLYCHNQEHGNESDVLREGLYFNEYGDIVSGGA